MNEQKDGRFHIYRKEYEPGEGITVRSVVQFNAKALSETGWFKMQYWRKDRAFMVPLVEKVKIKPMEGVPEGFFPGVAELEELRSQDLEEMLQAMPKGLIDVYKNPDKYYPGTLYSAPRMALLAANGKFGVPWHAEGKQGVEVTSYPQLQQTFDKLKAEVLEDLPFTDKYVTALQAEVAGSDELPEAMLRSLRPDQLFDQAKLAKVSEKFEDA